MDQKGEAEEDGDARTLYSVPSRFFKERREQAAPEASAPARSLGAAYGVLFTIILLMKSPVVSPSIETNRKM